MKEQSCAAVDDPRDGVDGDDRPDVDQLQNRIEDLESENEELREQLEACQKENRELRERTDGGIDTRSVVADLESIQDQDDLERTIERYKECDRDD